MKGLLQVNNSELEVHQENLKLNLLLKHKLIQD